MERQKKSEGQSLQKKMKEEVNQEAKNRVSQGKEEGDRKPERTRKKGHQRQSKLKLKREIQTKPWAARKGGAQRPKKRQSQ